MKVLLSCLSPSLLSCKYLNSNNTGDTGNSGGGNNAVVGKGSSNNWGVVDHVAGGVGGNMLLDRDLGNMVDLVMNIVANMLNNRGGGNSNWGSMSIGGNSRGGMSNSCDSGSSIGSNSWSSDSMTSSNKSMSVGGDTSYKAMSISTSKELSISLSISNWSSKATGNDSREDNKGLHLVLC